MFFAIQSQEVHDELMSLKTNKSSIDIPRTCIKLAADQINEFPVVEFSYVKSFVDESLKSANRKLYPVACF